MDNEKGVSSSISLYRVDLTKRGACARFGIHPRDLRLLEEALPRQVRTSTWTYICAKLEGCTNPWDKKGPSLRGGFGHHSSWHNSRLGNWHTERIKLILFWCTQAPALITRSDVILFVVPVCLTMGFVSLTIPAYQMCGLTKWRVLLHSAPSSGSSWCHFRPHQPRVVQNGWK